MLPNGFSKFTAYFSEKSEISKFFIYSEPSKIMSMYGAIFYEMGIFGAIIPYYFNKNLLKYKNIKTNEGLLSFILINMLLFTALPLATPFVGYFLGIFLYMSEQKR